MNNIIKKLAYICTGLAITTSAVAQAPHTSYFMESMPTRHQLNPALTPNYNYVNLPLIPLFSGIQIGLNSNVGMANFLYPRGNELVTGLHSSVSNDEFLGNIHRNNIIEANIKYNLVSFGFAKWGGYNTFDLSAHSITNMNMPYELFEFAKVGQINGEATTYNIPDLAISTYNYAELAIGHSRKITERLTVGAKFKFLAGIVHASAEINELNISMSQDKWQIQEKGRIFTTPGIQINYKDNGEIDNIDTGTFGMDGVGIGFDLGATYKLLDNLTLSAALTDIGFISWKGAEAKANPDPFIFDGFHHFGAEDDPVTGESQLDQETDQLEEDLKNLVRFQNNQDSKSTRSLTTTLNIGGEYSILSDKISFGLLSSTRFGLPTVWTELMASANFRPVSWFNATINGSFSNIGQSMGVLLNFNPKGFNFYIGSDYIPFRYSKEGIPLYHAKANITMGISFTFKHREK